ncbi:MAG TPA: FAD-dependent oxidoreductase, partial [Candidatus Polarisedimenticolaceae bacterium]|nr:FAD-dependent oxidoreductase [Candidatus Polarisedimenticolaceae bacterium]
YPEDTARILKKVRTILPQLADVTVLEEKVGLRPARDAIRLEAEPVGKGCVVHNYGHGGAGFSLSWGCAQEVVRLVNASFAGNTRASNSPAEK